MSVFAIYILAHLIGDYLLQTEYEAVNKANDSFWNRALWAHCLKYTLCFLPAFLLTGVGLWWLLLILGSHLVLDRRWFVLWWRRRVMRGSEDGIRNTSWLTVVVDQAFHALVLALIVALAL